MDDQECGSFSESRFETACSDFQALCAQQGQATADSFHVSLVEQVSKPPAANKSVASVMDELNGEQPAPASYATKTTKRYLTIRRPIVIATSPKSHALEGSQPPDSLSRSSSPGSLGEIDDDAFAVHRGVHRSSSKARESGAVTSVVLYSIVFSASYQVPILYFSFHGLPDGYKPHDLDTVYSLLVREREREQPSPSSMGMGMGMIGSISMAVSRACPCARTELGNSPFTK